jgi:sugar phosphate isomerase/epimerase
MTSAVSNHAGPLPPVGLGAGSLLQASLPELIASAAAAGFEQVSVRAHSFREALGSGWSPAALRDRLDRSGIAVSMLDGHISALPNRRAIEELDPAWRARLPPDVTDPPQEDLCFQASVALGAPVVALAHYLGLPTPLEVLAAALRDLCRRAAPHGLTIGIEFFPESGIPDLPFAQSLIRACGEPNVGVVLDLLHLDRSGGTVGDIHGLPANSIVNVQLSDRPRTAGVVPFGDRLLPGDGDVPLHEFTRAALQNSPRATLDLEVINGALRELPPELAARRLAEATARWCHQAL